jgi:hypothetical protein
MIPTLLLLTALADTPAVCLTPMQVRVANLMLDECERDREMLALLTLEASELDKAMRHAEAALELAKADRADCTRLDILNRAHIETLHDSVDRMARRTRVRERWLWILGSIAAVETAIIGVAVGTR